MVLGVGSKDHFLLMCSSSIPVDIVEFYLPSLETNSKFAPENGMVGSDGTASFWGWVF